VAITTEHVNWLRTAAAAGDSRAALELGKLLCLTDTDPHGSGGIGPWWPEEPWLRAAAQALPHDVEALMLLAGRLAQQVSRLGDLLDIQAGDPDDLENVLDLEVGNPDAMKAYGENADTVRRRRSEAEELYARIRAADPPGDWEPGLDELGYLLGAREQPCTDRGYSFYALRDDGWSGSAHFSVTIVASDADEIRWACDRWLASFEGGLGNLILDVYEVGAATRSIDLREHLDYDTVDWRALTVPDLSGRRLPAGSPVPGRGLYYGFSEDLE